MTIFRSKVVFDKPLCTLLYIGSSKVMKCKIEGGLGYSSVSDLQLWKLNGGILQNKNGLYKSGSQVPGRKWSFKSKGDLIRIHYRDKVWGASNTAGSYGISVDLEYIEDDKDEQLWKKGEPNKQGFFTLENYKYSNLTSGCLYFSLS